MIATMSEVAWKEMFALVLLLLLLSTAPRMAAGRLELREDFKETPEVPISSTSSAKYELCGNVTKCICVDTEVRKSIQCEGGRLRGQLPSRIVVPPDFTTIDFSRDSIPFIRSETFDGTYVSLSVVMLDFSSNDIEFIEDGTFEMFQTLRTLILRRNRIANLTLGAFRNLRQLENLDLSYNNIAMVDMDVLYPCISLRRLSMRFNPLPLQGLQDLLSSASTNLENLDLHGLNLQQIPDDLFRPVPYVQKLVLSGNRFLEVPGEALSRMRRLTVLDLSDNFITQTKDIDFEGLESLEELQLNQLRNLERVGSGSFATLRNLRIFSLSFNVRLRTIEDGAFPDPNVAPDSNNDYEDPLPEINGRDSSRKWQLEEVHLRQNALSTLPMSLLPWNMIRYVDLSENPWNCDCRLQWMKTINWDLHRVPEIRCFTPMPVRQRLIVEVAERDFRCENDIETHLAISAILLLVTGTLLATGCCLIACFTKPSCFNACRAVFQRRYLKLSSTGNGVQFVNKPSNNVTADVINDDLEMNTPVRNGNANVVTTAIR